MRGEIKVLKIAFNLLQEQKSLFRKLIGTLASLLMKSAQSGKIKAVF